MSDQQLQQQAPQQPAQPQTMQQAPQQPAQPQTMQQAPQQPAQPQTMQQSSYQSIIEQQQAQINALMQQNENLNQQVTRMVQNGAQFNSQQQPGMQPQYQNAYGGINNPAIMQEGQNEFAPVYAGQNTGAQFSVPSLAEQQDYSLEGLANEIGKKRD